MMTFKKRSEQFIEGFIHFFYVLTSELRITVHYDDSIFLNNRLNFLDSLLVRKTSIMRWLFLIMKLDGHVILRLFMNNIFLLYI